MRQIWTMALSDLRQRIRDKSVIIFAVLVPLALMGVLNIALGSATDPKLSPITVSASIPAGDPAASALIDAVKSIDGVSGMKVTVTDVAADAIKADVKANRSQMGIIVPSGYTQSLQGSDAEHVTVVDGDSGLAGSVVGSVITGVVDQFAASSVASRAGGELGLPASDLAAIAQQVATSRSTITLAQGQALNEQLSTSGALVAGQAGLFLLFTVGFGVMSLLTEQDQGTLARLRSMPMPTWFIVTAKSVVSFILGIVATTILLAIGSRLFSVDFGALVPIGVLVVCAVLAVTPLMLLISRVCRTSEQAGIAQSIVALVLGIAGGAFMPISASGLFGRLLDLNPIAAFIRGLGITSGGGGIGDLTTPVGILLGFGVVMVAVSLLVPNRGVAQ